MDRRNFLKAIGLGGVALTVPKPLHIVAATIADLERPPLHVGVTEIGPILMGTFHLEGVSVQLARHTAWREYLSFVDNWTISMGLRNKETRTTTAFLKTPVADVSFVALVGNRWGNKATGTSGTDKYHRAARPVRVAPTDTIEAWLVPGRPWGPEGRIPVPRRPLPPATLYLTGYLETDGRQFRPQTFWAAFDKVRLDRARAIELGLADPAEAFWDAADSDRNTTTIDPRKDTL